MFGDNWWNHDRVGPARLEGKTLHSRATLLIFSVMILRKCIRWSKGSSRPLYIRNFGKTKCNGASWCKVVGTNEDDDMSSNARSTESRLLRGEGDLTDWDCW